MSMFAYFQELEPTGDRRRSPRRSMRLGADGSGEPASLLDLSLTGALIETSVPMLVGAIFEVELPQAGRVEAEVVWNSGEFYGCQFTLPITPAVLSAAQLKAEAKPEPGQQHDPVTELKELNAEVERLAWKMDKALSRLSRK